MSNFMNHFDIETFLRKIRKLTTTQFLWANIFNVHIMQHLAAFVQYLSSGLYLYTQVGRSRYMLASDLLVFTLKQLLIRDSTTLHNTTL